MLELPSTRSADIRAGHAETGGGVHLDTGGGSPGDKWQLRELEQTQDSIAKETAKLAQEVQRLSKSVQESAKRVDAIPELLDTAPADGTGDSKGSVNAPVDSNVQAKAPIGTGDSNGEFVFFISVCAISMTDVVNLSQASSGQTRKRRPLRTPATTPPPPGPPRR